MIRNVWHWHSTSVQPFYLCCDLGRVDVSNCGWNCELAVADNQPIPSGAESCDGRGAGINITDRQRVWASAKSAQCQPAAPGKVDRTDEAALAANERRTLMGRLTRQQERALFIAEFVRRLRAAALGERVYMRVGDVFKDADVIELREWQAARRKEDERNV